MSGGLIKGRLDAIVVEPFEPDPTLNDKQARPLSGGRILSAVTLGIRPTLEGDRFLEEAALGLYVAIRRAEALQRGEHGELTVGVSVSFPVPSYS